MALPSWLDRPYHFGEGLKFGWNGWWSFYKDEVRASGSVDFAYWNALASGENPGGTGGGGGGAPPNPPPPPTAPATNVYDDSSWGLSVVGYDMPGARVSGTSVDLTYRIRLTSKWVAGAASPTYDTVTVQKIQFYAGDLNVPLKFYTGDPGNQYCDGIVPGPATDPSPMPIVPIPALPVGTRPPWWLPRLSGASYAPNDPNVGPAPDFSYYPQMRFSSTHFAPGSSIPVKAVVTLQFNNFRTGRKTVTLESPTYTFTASNKGLALASQLYAACGQDHYTYEPHPPTTGYYDWDSENAILGGPFRGASDGRGAVDALAHMNHFTVRPDDVFLSKAQVLAQLKEATAVFAYTHGESGGFLPSYGSAANKDASTPTDWLGITGVHSGGQGSTVWHAVRDSRTVPLPGMVVMYACSLLGRGTDLGVSMGVLTDAEAKIPDAAYAGFPDVVNDAVMDVDPDHGNNALQGLHLSDHAKAVYEALLGGKTIQQAIGAGNAICRTAHSTCQTSDLSPMSMQAKGDFDARLMGVYTGIPGVTTTNNQILPKVNGEPLWCLLLPPLPPGNASSSGSGGTSSSNSTVNP